MADNTNNTNLATEAENYATKYLNSFGTRADETESLSAAKISANLHEYEAARSGFFVLVVSGLNSIIKASYAGKWNEATDNNKIAQAEDYLKLNVVKCDVPHFSVAVHEYRRGNDVVKYAGVPTFNNGTVVVDDVIGLDTKSILMAWQGLTYNVHTRKGGRMINYKKNCTLIEYTQDYEEVREWTLYGCFISALSEDSFDKNNDGPRQITATIEYDRAVMVLPGEEEADTTGTESNTTPTQG